MINNKIIDERLIGRPIKRLGNYVSSNTKIEFKCLIESCSYIWEATPDNTVNKKRGCPKCSDTKLTNESIDNLLKDRLIKRLDNYINNKISINFQCLICFFIWKTSPTNIFNKKSGCPKCANKLKLTNEIIDKKLINRNIKRLDNYINNLTKIKFQCLKLNCNFIWKTTTNRLFSQKSGCPKCAGNIKLTNEIIDNKLNNRNIERLENYTNNGSLMNFKCLIDECGYIWSARWRDINKGSGCPKCVGKVKLTNEIIDERLKNRSIQRLDSYINSSTPIHFKCLIDNCLYIWKTSPNAIISNETGCPYCSSKKNEKLFHLTLVEYNIPFIYQQRLKNLNINNPNLIVDFMFYKHNIICEYNGKQHYEPVCFGGISMEEAETNFNKQKIRDDNLKNWCNKNNIILICIDGREYKNNKLKEFIINNILVLLK